MSLYVYIVLLAITHYGSVAQDEFSYRKIITNGFIENPVVQLVTETAGETVANVMNVITQIPNVISSSIGTYNVPTFRNRFNIMDVGDKFLAEYKFGLSNEDARLSIADLILKYGFPLEVHKVETEDGYILTMHRIPSNGSSVFLMHGLLASSDDFVTAGPDSGLAYLLSKDGYDVWMGNARGNKHSRQHTHLNPSQSKFWDFSWNEIGLYDLPAMIDCVLNETNTNSLKYIGHSQGTTAFFVMASELPEYNDKISLMVALSPVAFMAHVKSPIIRLLAPTGPFIHSALQGLGAHEFLPDNLLVRTLKKGMCGIGIVSEILCSNVVFLIVGFDFEQLNVTNLPVLLGHLPAGASSKQLIHYSQGMASGSFAKFDYGTGGNEKMYGSKTPPNYRLEHITAPVALFYSESDWLADPQDVDKLSKMILNVVEIYKIPTKRFNHLDFLLAKDFKTLIYDRLQYTLSLL